VRTGADMASRAGTSAVMRSAIRRATSCSVTIPAHSPPAARTMAQLTPDAAIASITSLQDASGASSGGGGAMQSRTRRDSNVVATSMRSPDAPVRQQTIRIRRSPGQSSR
jgi:hypothetical protein